MYVLRVPVNEWVNVCLCVCICLAIGLVFGAPSFNLSRILFYTHFQKEKKSKEWHLTGTEQSDRQTQKKRVSRSEKEKDVVKRQYCSKPVTAQMTDKQTKVAIFARHTLFCSALVVRRRKERHLFSSSSFLDLRLERPSVLPLPILLHLLLFQESALTQCCTALCCVSSGSWAHWNYAGWEKEVVASDTKKWRQFMMVWTENEEGKKKMHLFD